MRENRDPEMDIHLGQYQRLSQLQTWEHRPFEVAKGIEAISNMTIEPGGDLTDIEQEYLALRKEVLTPPFGKVITRAALGRSITSKGALLMGYWRLLKQDQYLKQEAQKQGVNIRPVSAPFALFAMAARLPEVGIVPQEYGHGTFLQEHYHRISMFGWNTIDEQVIREVDQDEVIVLLIESTAPATYPVTSSVPVEVAGEGDRFNSVVYNAALHEKTRPYFRLNAIVRNRIVEKEGGRFRAELESQSGDTTKAFRGKTKVVVNKQGRELSLESLSSRAQQEAANILRKSMAPPSAIGRNDQEVDRVLARLYQAGRIASPTDKDFFLFLIERLALNDKQFGILTSSWTGSRITYDLTYLTESLPAKMFPNILDT